METVNCGYPPPPANHDDLLTPKEVAALLRVDVRTVRRWMEMGRLPQPRRINDRVLYWRRGDVLEAMLEYRDGAGKRGDDPAMG
jgi:predicted DNA-binding transcriptional regulator AlpA